MAERLDTVVLALSAAGMAAFAWLAAGRDSAGRALRTPQEPIGEGPHWVLFAGLGGFYLAVLIQNFAAADRPASAVDVSLWTRVAVSAAMAAVIVAAASSGVSRLAELGLPAEGRGRDVMVGVLAGLAALPPTYLLIAAAGDLGGDHPLVTRLRESGTASDWLAVVLSAVVLAPLAEETAFRGVIQNGLARRLRPEAAIVLTATLFACVHPPETIVSLVPFAVGVGYVYHQTQSLIASGAMHATFNGSMLLALALETPPAAAP